MSVAIAGRSPETFEIKSARLTLLALRLKSVDLPSFEAELQAQYGDVPDFFSHEQVVVDLELLDETSQTALDFGALVKTLRGWRLNPIGVRYAVPEVQSAALEAGLPATDDTQVQNRSTEPEKKNASAETEDFVAPGAMVVDRPLRSGQQIYARGRDLVLMAMVNPGAEVIADGHIHVYAPLRGRAIAGARGWPEARIFSLDMQPELVSIAGVYRTSEDELPPSVWAHAAWASLASNVTGDTLIFKPLEH